MPYPDDGFPRPSHGDGTPADIAQYQLERHLLLGDRPGLTRKHDERVADILELLHGH